ncbi:MAG: hypothetical protein SVR94_14525 [Pseudomonadota bacterium]|nr:hypothetical protein [Pseudomonadota bacterium]
MEVLDEAGLVCSPSIEALAESVLKLANNPIRLAQMSKNAKALSQKAEFSWLAQAKKLLNIYQFVSNQ